MRPSATSPEIVGSAVRRLIDEDPDAFDALFDPLAARMRVSVSSEIATPLREAGLVEGEADQLWGLVRARRLGRRAYFLEVDEGSQYRQDVWPETDALLEVLAQAPVGRCADVGTGSGILAIEAAARGHSVVATDLFESAVELARFNARVNGVEGIDFRVGHLFVPVAGERFDLILTAPHYGRLFDQLRLEVLRASLDHLTPQGRLFLATTLEWEEDAPLGVESVLRALPAEVRVSPIVSPRTWFHFQQSGHSVPRLVSRHRFLVEVAAGGRGFEMAWPPSNSQPTTQVVPWSRLTHGAAAAVVDGADVAQLENLLQRLAQPSVRFDPPLPPSLLDACRWGKRSCERAAGALVDLDGKIRPCTHGSAVAGADDSLASLTAIMAQLAESAALRRGCTDCAARPLCSQCLFPAAVDEAAYCDLIRAHSPSLPLLHRLLEIAGRVGKLVQLDRWPREIGPTPAWPALTERWNQRAMWLVGDGERRSAWWLAEGRLQGQELDEPLAWLGAQVGDGVDAATLSAAHQGPPRRLEKLAERLAHLLELDPRRGLARTVV